MTPIEQDKQAAILYLEHWQLGESGQHRHWNSGMRQHDIERRLEDTGYPHPNTIVYDNEAIPWVRWKDPSFNATDYIFNYTKQFE